MPSTIDVIIRTLTQFWPPASKWTPTDMPDLSGKVVLVTGGNAGIGKEMIKYLLQANARVYLAARSRSKAMDAIGELERETGRVAEFLELDLGTLEKVKESAEVFKRCVYVLFLPISSEFDAVDAGARRGLTSYSSTRE